MKLNLRTSKIIYALLSGFGIAYFLVSLVAFCMGHQLRELLERVQFSFLGDALYVGSLLMWWISAKLLRDHYPERDLPRWVLVLGGITMVCYLAILVLQFGIIQL